MVSSSQTKKRVPPPPASKSSALKRQRVENGKSSKLLYLLSSLLSPRPQQPQLAPATLQQSTEPTEPIVSESLTASIQVASVRVVQEITCDLLSNLKNIGQVRLLHY